jgi:DivIVA domain-containing protein
MTNKEQEQRMTDIVKRRPEFTTSIRGYDRLQVDDYIDRLDELLTDAEQRARQAESELEFSRHTTVGPRVTEIFDLAVAESKDLRERVQEETGAMLDETRQRAQDIVDDAHSEAAETRARSQREREEAIAKLDAERQRAHGQVVVLQRRQAELLGDLRQLQEALAAAARVIPQESDLPTEECEPDGATTEQAALPAPQEPYAASA